MKLSIPFCFSLCLTPYSLQSGNHLSWTLLHAFLASYALIIINMGQIALHQNGFRLTLLCTKLTANAACCTGFLYLRPPCMTGAGNGGFPIAADQFNQILGTHRHTAAATGAFLRIHHRCAVLHMDCVKSAGFHTGAKSQTAVITESPDRTAERQS